jgi:tetratricopeptide (TPR) repeat protein
MEQRRLLPVAFQAITLALLVLASGLAGGQTQAGVARPQTQTGQAAEAQLPESTSSQAEAELQTGISLTRRGLFKDAIPHFLAARGQVANEYAADFNLALCYVGTGQFKPAIQILDALRTSHENADVFNLLSQAYVGNDQPQESLKALQKAAALTPTNEKLYVLVADACLDHRDYSLALKVVDLGLKNLPDSARLHYQRAMFLSSLDGFDLAKGEFELAAKLAPESNIAYSALAQKDLLEGNVSDAVRVAREGIRTGHEDFILQALLGESLIRNGLSPSQPEFVEAKSALEKSVATRPNFAGSQIALGKLYLMERRLDDAIVHLEIARQLEPGDTSVYSNLATAYRRQGKPQEAQKMLAILARLNEAQAERIRSAPGDSKAGYITTITPH